ncbi:MAG: OmpH family outer membrane protein [Thermodesulfobacteriota bacterium]
MKVRIVTALAAVLFCFMSFGAGGAMAADKPVKVATISIQGILDKSKAAQEAKKGLEAEFEKHKGKLEKEQTTLEALRSEIEKKSSVWSEEMRGEKEREYQRLAREFGIKNEDAKIAMQQKEKQLMDPILKELHGVIDEIGKKNGYTLILEYSMKGLRTRTGLLYADDALDITDTVQKELDKRLKK